MELLTPAPISVFISSVGSMGSGKSENGLTCKKRKRANFVQPILVFEFFLEFFAKFGKKFLKIFRVFSNKNAYRFPTPNGMASFIRTNFFSLSSEMKRSGIN